MCGARYRRLNGALFPALACFPATCRRRRAARARPPAAASAWAAWRWASCRASSRSCACCTRCAGDPMAGAVVDHGRLTVRQAAWSWLALDCRHLQPELLLPALPRQVSDDGPRDYRLVRSPRCLLLPLPPPAAACCHRRCCRLLPLSGACSLPATPHHSEPSPALPRPRRTLPPRWSPASTSASRAATPGATSHAGGSVGGPGAGTEA